MKSNKAKLRPKKKNSPKKVTFHKRKTAQKQKEKLLKHWKGFNFSRKGFFQIGERRETGLEQA